MIRHSNTIPLAAAVASSGPRSAVLIDSLRTSLRLGDAVIEVSVHDRIERLIYCPLTATPVAELDRLSTLSSLGDLD